MWRNGLSVLTRVRKACKNVDLVVWNIEGAVVNLDYEFEGIIDEQTIQMRYLESLC